MDQLEGWSFALFSIFGERKQLFLRQLVFTALSFLFFFFNLSFFSPLSFFPPPAPALDLSGGFSETYSALCDYNGISCKEEVQWVRGVMRLRPECLRVLHACCNPTGEGKMPAAERADGWI